MVNDKRFPDKETEAEEGGDRRNNLCEGRGRLYNCLVALSQEIYLSEGYSEIQHP